MSLWDDISDWFSGPSPDVVSNFDPSNLTPVAESTADIAARNAAILADYQNNWANQDWSQYLSPTDLPSNASPDAIQAALQGQWLQSDMQDAGASAVPAALSVAQSSPSAGFLSGLESGLGAMDGTLKKYQNVLGLGAGALSLLTGMGTSKKNAAFQKVMLDQAMADKAARAARSAAINRAPVVGQDYSTPRVFTGQVGPTVSSDYGRSSRGSSSFNAPSNYVYWSGNKGFSKGGLATLGTPKTPVPHVQGGDGGQDDTVPAMLSHGEYVMDADTVSALGDGNNDAGAQKLDQMRQNVRAHKRSGPLSQIPPKAKEPMAYLPKKGK